MSTGSFAQTEPVCKLEFPKAVSGTETEEKPAYWVAISSNCPIKKVNVSVYNRWGELMYETTELNHIWAGKNSETGTYNVVVSGEYSTGEPFKMTGSVTYFK